MDTLWASLIALFLIALAVVLAFNLLQGRQTRLRDAWREKLKGAGRPARPAAAARPPGGASARAGEPATRPASAPAPAQRIEPTFGPAPAPAAPSVPSARDAARFELPDPDDVSTGGPGQARRDGHDRFDEPDGRDARVRGEPALDAGTASGDAHGRAPGRRSVHDTDDTHYLDAPVAGGDREPERDDATGPILDPRLDCIVPFGLASPVTPERLLAAASTLRRAGSKPIAVEADAGDGRWAVPHAAIGALRRVRAGVLLANRHGPLNAMEFSDFSNAMQSLGRAIGAGGAIVPDMAPVLDHARQLDEACAQFDAVIGLNVETTTALSPGELAALASGLGLHERGNNRFAALDDDGAVLFSLALGERAEQLTLLLDVPRAPQGADPWGRMVEAARLCAERTGGRVVDDANRPLTDAAAAEVDRQLGLRYRSLGEAGLDAGSPAALRVFN